MILFLLAAANMNIAMEAQPTGTVLPPFEKVRPSSDSVSLVRAADDALQGASSITVPMRVVRFHRSAGIVEVALVPQADSAVVWRNRGGTVRMLANGRRIIVSRQ